MENTRKPVIEKSATTWMLTFADLLALLLTFFVLLFSMNKLTEDDWRDVVTVMAEQFNPERQDIDISDSDNRAIVDEPRERGLNLTYLMAQTQNQIDTVEALAGFQVYLEGERLAIAMPSVLLFEPNTSELLPETETRIAALAQWLFQVRNRVIVAGHTPVEALPGGAQYRDGWQLGLARSRIIAQLLKDNGYLISTTAISYGDGRAKDLPDDIALSRRAYWADRVDIVLVQDRKKSGYFDL